MKTEKGFFEMVDELLDYNVDKVVFAYKDELSKAKFELFKHMFRKFGRDSVVTSKTGNMKPDSEGYLRYEI